MDTTASSVVNAMQNRHRVRHHCDRHDQSSAHSSPYSASLPSPPDSPPLDPYADTDLDSISSFPSGSSSVFFSSSAGSPHWQTQEQARRQEHESDAAGGLIIPSLTLPSALRQPTAYGQILGDLSVLLVGPKGSGKTALAEYLTEADDVVDCAEWEDIEGGGGRVLRASTEWVEEHDAHGLERFEGTWNVTLTELDGINAADSPARAATRILNTIHAVFRDVRSQIDSAPSSQLLHSLLASSHSPLYTVLIYVTATPLTDQDREIVSRLSSAVPVIPFCTTSLSSGLSVFSHRTGSLPKLASFLPQSQVILRSGLFRVPQTLAALRTEAADRFMRWHEAERAIEDTPPFELSLDVLKAHIPAMHRRGTVTQFTDDAERWDKAAWEAMLSEDVARRLKETHSLGEKSKQASGSSSLSNSVLFMGAPCFAPVLDPLHFRSLMLLSLSIFAPPRHPDLSKNASMDETRSTVRPGSSRRKRGGDDPDAVSDKWRIWRWGFALFCAGVGIGCVLSALT